MQPHASSSDNPERLTAMPFVSAYPPIPLPPPRRPVRWRRLASLALLLALGIGLVALIVHPLTPPEGHATYAVRSTAGVHTASGHTVSVTIDRIVPNATSNVPTAPGYARYTVFYTLQDDRDAPDAGSFKWELHGTNGQVYTAFRHGAARSGGRCSGCPIVSTISTAFVEWVVPAGVTGQSLTGTLLHETRIFNVAIAAAQGRLSFDPS